MLWPWLPDGSINVQRLHLGEGMESQPLEVLYRSGYNGADQIALFLPLILDETSTDLILICDPEGGNGLLTYYMSERSGQILVSF